MAIVVDGDFCGITLSFPLIFRSGFLLEMMMNFFTSLG
jgi:hypothetical protein